MSGRRRCRTGEVAAVLRGAPPKVVWLRIGNCSSEAVERLLRAHATVIHELERDPERVILELYD
ncbi:MAG TPA: DUF5615 family PIN-like protein [Thermoanaerobaculia bacterium]